MFRFFPLNVELRGAIFPKKAILAVAATFAFLSVASIFVPFNAASAAAFEPTSDAETALYNERLIPAPVSVSFGRGVVVFNDRLQLVVVRPDVADAAETTAIVDASRRFFADRFGADVDVAATTSSELRQFVQTLDRPDAIRAEIAQFADSLADDADDFFNRLNAARTLALADAEIASDAAASEIAERRETSRGTLVVAAPDAAGVRDALKTLEQLAETFGDGDATLRYFVPETKIDDAPALAFRGIHLCWFPETDASRIEQAIRIAAFYKFNYVVVEFWGTFPFENHKELYWDEFHTTKAEVVRLVRLAKELGIEPIPQMNLFGHATASRVSVGKHVVLDRYPELAPLFEPDGWTWRVSNPQTRALLTECVLELYETFDRPRYFHLGCDEAYSAGTGFEARRDGDYLDQLVNWLQYFRDLLAERDCRPLMWHDMLIEPSEQFAGYVVGGSAKTRGLIDRLPSDVVVCDWQYGAPKADETWPTTAFFRERGFETIVCPWRDVVGIRSLATDAAKKGSLGVLCTTWHHFSGNDMRQILVYGAQAAWGTRYRGGAFLQAFNRHLRQASRAIPNKTYQTGGVDDWQVDKETTGPKG